MAEPVPRVAVAVRRALRERADPVRARGAARYFKTGPGEYGEGDRFIGVTVPAQRAIARRFRDLPLPETDRLLQSPIHEERLTALLILVDQFTRPTSDARQRDRIFRLFLRRLRFVNNWDLVDSSASVIVGGWLCRGCAANPGPQRGTNQRGRKAAHDRLAARPQAGLAPQARQTDLLTRLARSKDLWSRRVSMIATAHFINHGEYGDAIRIATLLVDDEHDLIHKAVGWMLREVGKRASEDALRAFLTQHAATMPRTALRYAIERMPASERARWRRMATRSSAAPVARAHGSRSQPIDPTRARRSSSQ